MVSNAPDHPNPTDKGYWLYHWLLAALMIVLSAGAFAVLLGNDYSPVDYRAYRSEYGFVETVWLQLACLEAVGLLVGLWLHPVECRRFTKAGGVAMVASAIVLGKRLLGARPQCLDPLLFSTACGWTVTLWLRSNPLLDGSLNRSPRWGKFLGRLQPVALLQGVVWTATACLALYYIAQQIRYFESLELGYPDCGDAARLMYNTISNPRELFLRYNSDKPLFYDHIQPGILPFVPLWFLCPNLKVTFLLQALAIVGSAVPIYWIGKGLLGDKTTALLLVTAWLVFPSVSQFIYNNSYGFHWANLCVLLYLSALACWIHRRTGWAWLLALWSVLLKEEAAVVLGTFGLYLALFGRRRKLGLAIFVGASVYFLLASSLIVPATSPLQRFFTPLGVTKWEIMFSPITKPRVFWGRLLSPATFYFASLLLAPLLFVPLKKASVLLTGSLVFVFDCLSPVLKNICFWYQATLLPVVFWSLAAALQTANRIWQRAILLGAITSGLLLSVFFGNAWWSKPTMPTPQSHGRLRLVERMARQIDPQGSLFATQRVAAHFITQKYLSLNTTLPADLDYVILDLRDCRENTSDVQRTPLVFWLEEPLSWLRTLQHKVEARPDLRLVDAADGLLLYARRGPPLDSRRIVEQDALPPEAVHRGIKLGGGAEIVGYRIDGADTNAPSDSELARVTIFSRVPARTNSDVAARCVFDFGSDATGPDRSISDLQPLGQGIWPVSRWETNKFYTDTFLMPLPRRPSARITNIRFEYVVLPE